MKSAVSNQQLLIFLIQIFKLPITSFTARRKRHLFRNSRKGYSTELTKSSGNYIDITNTLKCH